MRQRCALAGVAVAGWLVVVAAETALAVPPPLRRDLGSYGIFASRLARVQNLSLPSACNVGVNCATPPGGSPRCGKLVLGSAHFAAGSQAVGDRVLCTKPGAALWQLFSNGGTCGDASIEVVPPQPFTPPVIPGTCGDGCTPDVAALKASCGFPDPFPACDPGRPVTVRPGEDCDGAVDADPGNLRCDLSPGTYGTVQVQNGGRLGLGAGAYAVCGLLLGRGAEAVGPGATIAIPASYDLRVGDGGRLGSICGAVTVQLDGEGAAAVGRHAGVAARVCAPERRLRVGGGASVSGQLVGDTVVTGRDVLAVCCCSDCPGGDSARSSP